MKHLKEYRDGELSGRMIDVLQGLGSKRIRIMEVCGTHTVSIFRNGIRSILPDGLTLLSGPGCPVCVTDQGEIDAAIALASVENTIITTFGDLVRVPGTRSTLQREQASGKDVRIVYSTFDALAIAREHPDKTVVFIGIGFETTAPTIAASILTAAKSGLSNFSVLSLHKTMPPALDALMGGAPPDVDGFLLPGHVSVIIGADAYTEFFEKYRIPCAIAGFEPVDILQALIELTQMIENGRPEVVNSYARAVTPEGNCGALSLMDRVFTSCDAVWRGIGTIPGSGLAIRNDFAAFDAMARFGIAIHEVEPPRGCACGDILTGSKPPPECPLYKRRCTPLNPVGPCMVSSEGTCAAFYRYHG
jgi:hydrogenase expression/formation protein HypD